MLFLYFMPCIQQNIPQELKYEECEKSVQY